VLICNLHSAGSAYTHSSRSVSYKVVSSEIFGILIQPFQIFRKFVRLITYVNQLFQSPALQSDAVK